MRMLLLSMFAAILCGCRTVGVNGVYSITDFGAKGDGETLNTTAIQAALDACAETGGVVLVPPGVYKTGTIWLKSNTELRLEHGATLLGSPNLDDYNAPDAYPQNYNYPPEGWSAKHLIIAHEVENVAITGSGTIDGNARTFFAEEPESVGLTAWRAGGINVKGGRKTCARPGQNIVFIESRNIRVIDVHLKDMTCWSCFLHGCENVQVRGLHVDNNTRYLNTDGLDIDSCRNVTVSDCVIRTGDDAFAIRGASQRLKDKTRVCENIVIANSTAWVSASGIRVGVGTGKIRSLRVENVVFEHAGTGLNVQCAYGATSPGVDISDISFAHITLKKCNTCISVSGGRSNAVAPLHDISFDDIHGETTGGTAIKVTAAGKTVPERVRFSNVAIEVLPPLYEKETKQIADDFAAGKLAPAVRVEGAKDVRFDNVSLIVAPEMRKLFGESRPVTL